MIVPKLSQSVFRKRLLSSRRLLGYLIGSGPDDQGGTIGTMGTDGDTPTRQAHRRNASRPVRLTIVLLVLVCMAMVGSTCYAWRRTHTRLLRAEEALAMFESGSPKDASAGMLVLVDSAERTIARLHELAKRDDLLGKRAQVMLARLRESIR